MYWSPFSDDDVNIRKQAIKVQLEFWGTWFFCWTTHLSTRYSFAGGLGIGWLGLENFEFSYTLRRQSCCPKKIMYPRNIKINSVLGPPYAMPWAEVLFAQDMRRADATSGHGRCCRNVSDSDVAYVSIQEGCKRHTRWPFFAGKVRITCRIGIHRRRNWIYDRNWLRICCRSVIICDNFGSSDTSWNQIHSVCAIRDRL